MRSTSALFLLCGAVTLAGARLGAQVSPPAPQVPGTVSSASGVDGTQPVASRRARRQRGQRGGMARALLNGISLTDAQRSQLTTIESRYREEHRALRGTGTRAATGAVGRDTASRAAARDLRQRELADMRGVLTPAQQTTFDRNVQAWRAGAKQRRAART